MAVLTTVASSAPRNIPSINPAVTAARRRRLRDVDSGTSDMDTAELYPAPRVVFRSQRTYNGVPMDVRRLGPLSVSVVGLGCNNFGMRLDYARSEAVVHAALDAGITLFDTADIYGATKSEEFLGRALGSRRPSVVIATKFGMPVDADRKGARPAYVRQALDDSLRRLGTDWVDLYQLHQPDPTTP